MRPTWLVLQLADGAFPNGGFAHSGGLEAAAVLGGLDGGAEAFLDASVRQIGRSQLPFVAGAAADPAELSRLDEALDAAMPLRAPNLASRSQGRAFVRAASRIWDALRPLAEHSAAAPTHHAPVFGAACGTLGVAPDAASAAYLHGATRTILSASVRLGLLGPIEAQRLLAERAPLLEATLADARGRRIEDAAATAPRIELFAGLHDRLDGRMFQS
jgi:urease accessory protein